jgi:magnesium transporter
MAHEATPPGQDSVELRSLTALKNRHPRDIADEIRDLPLARVREILRELPDAFAAEVISQLPRDVQVRLFESMQVSNLSGIVDEMFSDDVADVLGHVSAARLREIMNGMPPEEARQISDLLKYPEDTAGGIMQTEVIAVPEDVSIADALALLRREEEDLPNGIFYIYVTDAERRLRGVLRVRDLLFRPSNLKIRDIMVSEVRAVSVHADQEEIARLCHAYGFSAIPVVDDFQRLRGVVTADDVLDVVEKEATEDMQRMVGLSGEEAADTPWMHSVRNRLPWLYFNLATAFLAGWVVSLFETTIAKYAVLAIFLPIIAGQGGNAGTQTLTIIVRSIALGELSEKRHRSILAKEILVGLLNGLAIGLVVGGISWLWRNEFVLGVITFAAMALNMVAAGIAGVVIPLGLKALRIDPALASAILLTTVTDVVGFFLFLGLAALILSSFPSAL